MTGVFAGVVVPRKPADEQMAASGLCGPGVEGLWTSSGSAETPQCFRTLLSCEQEEHTS